MGLFGGSKSKSKTNVTTVTTVSNPAADADESAVFQNIDGNVTFAPTDLGAVDKSLDLAQSVVDTQGQTVYDVLGFSGDVIDENFGFSSDVIQLQADQFERTRDQTFSFASLLVGEQSKAHADANAAVADAFARSVQGGINTEKVLTNIIIGIVSVGGLWIVFRGRKQ